MFRLIRASFNQRRKTLQNGLNNSPELSFSKEEIAAVIEGLGLPAAVRGEALTLEQFCSPGKCIFRPERKIKQGKMGSSVIG